MTDLPDLPGTIRCRGGGPLDGQAVLNVGLVCRTRTPRDVDDYLPLARPIWETVDPSPVPETREHRYTLRWDPKERAFYYEYEGER